MGLAKEYAGVFDIGRFASLRRLSFGEERDSGNRGLRWIEEGVNEYFALSIASLG